MSDSTEYIFESLVEFREPPQDTNLAQELVEAFRRHSTRTLIVDALSGREWSGSKLLDYSGRIATCLVERAAVEVNDVVMTICDRADSELVVALGVLLAGASIYPTTPIDGYNEAQMLCELVRPQVILINRRYHEIAVRLCREVPGMSATRIIWVEGAFDSCGVSQAAIESGQLDENNNNNTSLSDEKLAGAPAFEIRLADLMKSQKLDEHLIDSIVSTKIRSHEHIASLLLTSGSTGRPKVVPATHFESVASLYCMISAATNPLKGGATSDKDTSDMNGYGGADSNNNSNINNGNHENIRDTSQDNLLLPVGPQDVLAGDLPLDHGAGLNVMFLSLWLGSKYIVMPSFDTRVFWRAVSDYKISFSLASTAFCFQLFSQLKSDLASDKQELELDLDLSSLRTISCCGAKMSFVELVNEIRARFKHLTINQSYGCTENGYISNLIKRDAGQHLDSVGYLFPGIRAKLIEPSTGKTLGPNERGELLIWSKSLFKGYRCHPEVDERQIFGQCHDERGEFYRTGDQAHFDSDGRLYVHGRYKDTLVLYGDWKIMPAELEEIVEAHPLVEASAVVGLVDPELPSCHKPRAFVRLVRELDKPEIGRELASRFAARDQNYIAEHIRQFVADRVAPAKQLTGGVRILEDFPRIGLLRKIDRKALREIA